MVQAAFEWALERVQVWSLTPNTFIITGCLTIPHWWGWNRMSGESDGETYFLY